MLNGIANTNPDAAPPRRRVRMTSGFAVVLLAAVATLVVGLLVGPAPFRRRRSRARWRGGWAARRRRVVARRVVWSVRLPARAGGLRGGGGLAMAGAALQGLFRNPLAEPGVLGISSGASLGAVLAIYFKLAGRACGRCPSARSRAPRSTPCWCSPSRRAMGAGACSRRRCCWSASRSMALNMSLTTFVLSVSLASYDVGRQVMYWLLGGLEGRDLGPPGAGRAADRWWARRRGAHARELDALMLGELGAQSVGIDVPRVRHPAGAGERAGGRRGGRRGGADRFRRPAGAARAPAGGGSRAPALLPLSFLGGGMFLVIADVVARTLLVATEMPVGVVTAAVGAPVFLALLVRRRVEVAGP